MSVHYPCAQYNERSLNTNLVDPLAGLRLLASSLPHPLPAGSSFLAAGVHGLVTGAGGSMNVLLVSEVYDQLFFAVPQ